VSRKPKISAELIFAENAPAYAEYYGSEIWVAHGDWAYL
jgi:UDP-2,3-diacylglucosamine pyrophosphatase LpxH